MDKRSIGNSYEQIAYKYLESIGYNIIERNFKSRSGEIDIIAKKDGYIRFIEVKYRSSPKYGFPEEAVDYKKQRLISRAASYYLYKHKYSEDTLVCFDVVAILDNEIILYENAFEYCG